MDDVRAVAEVVLVGAFSAIHNVITGTVKQSVVAVAAQEDAAVRSGMQFVIVSRASNVLDRSQSVCKV